MTGSLRLGVLCPHFAPDVAPTGEVITRIPGDLTGTLTQAAAGGVATFSMIQLTAPGMGYTLRATAPGLADGVSAPFNVAP